MRETQYFPFKGGINTDEPALSIPAGEVIDGYNYEPVTTGGYRRVDGFERWDGGALPSDATYYVLNFDAGTTEPADNITLVGATSGAEGVVLETVLTSGSWAGNDAAGYFVIYVLSGTFINDETINYYSPAAFTSGFTAGFN